MGTPVINAKETHVAISDAGNSTYVDVRTVAEFAEGRPKGRALNIPIVFFHPTTGSHQPERRVVCLLI